MTIARIPTTSPRRFETRVGGSVAPSRMAETGGIRVARMAGIRLEIIVTPMPSTSETITVRAANTRPVCGSERPSAVNTALRPTARPSPAKRPTTEASSPVKKLSMRTERSTCRREAPSDRSVANSRIRCATVIEMVLKVTKAPTMTAMPAKASRK